MNLSAALVVYILVAVIGGVIKKLAEIKTAEQRRMGRSHDATGDAVPFYEIDSAEEIFADDSHLDSVEETQGIFAETEFDSEDWEEEREQAPPAKRSSRRRWQPNMAQAVIMSEILRSPRAKRPWPER